MSIPLITIMKILPPLWDQPLQKVQYVTYKGGIGLIYRQAGGGMQGEDKGDAIFDSLFTQSCLHP